MRYNLIAWKLDHPGPEPILICDTWTSVDPNNPILALKDAMETVPRATRAIVIDFATNKVIYEAKTTLNGYFIDTLDDKPKTYIKIRTEQAKRNAQTHYSTTKPK